MRKRGWTPDQGWARFALEQRQELSRIKAEALMKGEELPPQTRRRDWLTNAIWDIGGPSTAAKRIGISRAMLYRWLEFGIGEAKYRYVKRLSDLAEVPMPWLREGPYHPETGRKRKS